MLDQIDFIQTHENNEGIFFYVQEFGWVGWVCGDLEQVSEIYLNWEEKEGISKIASKEEVTKNDYNLSPSRYVAQKGLDDTLPLEDVVVLLQEAEEERKKIEEKLINILKRLGLG